MQHFNLHIHTENVQLKRYDNNAIGVEGKNSNGDKEGNAYPSSNTTDPKNDFINFLDVATNEGKKKAYDFIEGAEGMGTSLNLRIGPKSIQLKQTTNDAIIISGENSDGDNVAFSYGPTSDDSHISTAKAKFDELFSVLKSNGKQKGIDFIEAST